MADTTPNLGLPLIDLTEPNADTLAEGAAKLRAAFTTLDTVYQQLANSLQSPDAGTLGGQTLAQVLALANAAGILPVAKGGTGAATPEAARTALGFDSAWDARWAQQLAALPEDLDTLAEMTALMQSNEDVGVALNAAIASLQSGKQDALTLVTQEDAEAGVGTTIKGWSEERIAQAIAAWAGGGGGSPGEVTVIYGNTAKEGTVKINGATLSRAAYPELWTFAQTSGVLAATEGGKNFWEFGPGDGSTTFSMPEVRGEFPRFWDDGRGIDSGRTIGSWQSDEFKSHTHTGTERGPLDALAGGAPGNYKASASTTTGSAGGAETRPRSIALLACMYF